MITCTWSYLSFIYLITRTNRDFFFLPTLKYRLYLYGSRHFVSVAFLSVSKMDQIGVIADYFHYPNGKTKEYVEFRQCVTMKYGLIMGCITMAVLTWIPIQNYLLSRGKWYFSRVHVLGPLNLRLDKVILWSEHSNRPLVGRTCTAIKAVAYKLYLNSSTMFQIFLWMSIFLVLALTDIHHGDLIFVTKRLGRLAVVALPTVFFLTLRPSPLPNTLYLALLPIHKWLARVVVLLAVVHTIIYLGYFHKTNSWAKAGKTANLYGWMSLFGFLMILITSLLKARDRFYKLFFLNHYFWSWVIVLCLPFHVRPVNTTYANILNVLILSYQVYNRLKLTMVASSPHDFKIIDVSPNIAFVEFPNYLIKNRAINPGAHVRITNYHPNFIVRAYKQLIPNYHPYTLASLPLDRYQRLIIRKSSFKWVNGQRYIVNGSFDPKLLLVKSRNDPKSNFSISKLAVNARKILIVIGGSAISFALPILRVLNYHGIPVKVIWVIRDFRDIAVLRYFDGFIQGEDFEIFVTGSPAIDDGFDLAALRNATSYGTFRSARLDLENNDFSRLVTNDPEDFTSNQEMENVIVDLSDEEDENDLERDCTSNLFHDSPYASEENSDGEVQVGEDVVQYDDVRSRHSRRSSRSYSINEQFIPQLEKDNECHEYYKKTVQRLHLEHHIYKGRPKLNYRYYNWCANAADIFTQCSGPVLDESSNLVCCRDLPGRHQMNAAQQLPDVEKVWVISAGPKSLVKNVKLWASENGLKYHEEAFYV